MLFCFLFTKQDRPRVIKATITGQHLDLTDIKNLPDFVPAWLRKYGTEVSFQHEFDKRIVPWMKEHGFTKLTVKDVAESGFKSTIALPEAVEIQPLVVSPTVEEKVVKTTVETKTNAIKANVKEASVEATGTVDAIRRNVLRAEDAVGFWGTAGKKVQKDLREISARTAINVGNTSQNIRAILKGLNSKEKVIVSQLTDKAISKKGQPRRLVEQQ